MNNNLNIDRASIQMRDPHLDTMKAILIVLVVFGHCISNLFDVHSSLIFLLIYSFHMPAWFMSSGIVFYTSGKFTDFVRKKARALLYPLIGFIVILEVYYLGMNFLQYNIGSYLLSHFKIQTIVKSVLFIQGGNWGGVWYLPTLFILYLIGFVLNKINNKKIQLIAILLLTVLGYQFINYNIFLPFYSEISLIALPFFYAGKPIYKWLLSMENQKKKVGVLFIALIGWAATVYCFFYQKHLVVQMVSGNVGNLYQFYLVGMLGSISIMAISILVSPLKLVKQIGQETLFIYGYHYPVVAFARFILRRIVQFNNIYILTLISLLVSIIIILSLLFIKKILQHLRISKYIV